MDLIWLLLCQRSVLPLNYTPIQPTLPFISKFCYDQKLNVIISVLYFNNFIFKNNKKLFKNYFQIYLKADIKDLVRRDYKKLYSKNINKKT